MRRSNFILEELTKFKNRLLNRQVGDYESMKFARKYADKTWGGIKKGMRAVGKEANETEEMAISFFKILEHKLNLSDREDPPTKEEVKRAIEQLKDVGRFSLFTTMVILPGGVISLVGLDLLARKLGLKDFTLVPTSFRKKEAHSEKKVPTDNSEFQENRERPENSDTSDESDLTLF